MRRHKVTATTCVLVRAAAASNRLLVLVPLLLPSWTPSILLPPAPCRLSVPGVISLCC